MQQKLVHKTTETGVTKKGISTLDWSSPAWRCCCWCEAWIQTWKQIVHVTGEPTKSFRLESDVSLEIWENVKRHSQGSHFPLKKILAIPWRGNLGRRRAGALAAQGDRGLAGGDRRDRGAGGAVPARHDSANPDNHLITNTKDWFVLLKIGMTL